MGILYRKQFRVLLNSMKLAGNGDYIETKGFLESIFVVRAPNRIHVVLMAWIKEINTL